jgi:hypothetical protein
MMGRKNCEGHGWGGSADTFRRVDGSECIKVKDILFALIHQSLLAKIIFALFVL